MSNLLIASLLSIAFTMGTQEPQSADTSQEKILESPVSEAVVSGKPITIGSSFKLKSDVLQSERELNVWLPASYGSGDRTYSALFVIDGGMEQDFHHISGLAQLATINGSFQELIVVGIKTENRFMELTHKPTDPRYIRTPATAGKSDIFLRHITDEVIPFVNKRYRVGERRAVIGESLAGLFVAEVFLKSPRTFTDYIAISPSLWWDDKRLAKNANQHLQAHDGKVRRLYLTMADEGGTMQAGLDLLIEAIKKNKPTGLSLEYVDRRTIQTHATIYHGAAHDALIKSFKLEQPDYGDPPWYMIEGGKPPTPENSPADEDEE